VLSPFSAEEQTALSEIIDRCVAGILSFVSIGIERSMNEVNRK
jgi:peptidyl-tRNA hydrolase